MAKEALDRYQQAILELVGQDRYIRNHFYLTGGTALAAFYLHHRRSYDLDFFQHDPVAIEHVTRLMNGVVRALKLKPYEMQKVYDRYEFLLRAHKQTIKVEFVQYQFKQLQRPRTVDSLKVDSLKDIAANKLFAAIDRNEPKDLVDLAFLLQEKFTLKALARAVATKFGFEIDKAQFLTIFERGRHMQFAKPDLLRTPKIPFARFYENELRNLGRQILVP